MSSMINNITKSAISLLEPTAKHIDPIFQIILVDYRELFQLPEEVFSCQTLEDGESKMIDISELAEFIEAKQTITATLEDVKEALLLPGLKEAGISCPVCDTIDLVNALSCSKKKSVDSALRKSKRGLLQVIDYLGKLQDIIKGQALWLCAVKAKKPVKKRLTSRQFLNSTKVKTEAETRKEKGALL
ncbi:hypothetical protein YB2330_005240 [Saitoella coloradoensis]